MKPIAAFWSGVAAASLVGSATVYASRVAADVGQPRVARRATSRWFATWSTSAGTGRMAAS